MKMNKGKLIVFSGPSGSGKDTVLEKLLPKCEITKSISATTRDIRVGEKDGVDYYFVSREEFEKMIEEGQMLEYTQYVGNYYGTPKAPINKWLMEGKNVLLKIEVDGGAQIKEKMPECVSIFILPPSEEELERRLRGRGTDDEAATKKRLETAKLEMQCAKLYDYNVVNDDLDTAVEEIIAIIEKER